MLSLLVVEDEPAIAESLAYSLRREGYAVDLAGSLAEAEGKKDWVEKTPHHVNWVDRILETLPDEIPFDVGAAFQVQALTAYHMLHTVYAISATTTRSRHRAAPPATPAISAVFEPLSLSTAAAATSEGPSAQSAWNETQIPSTAARTPRPQARA